VLSGATAASAAPSRASAAAGEAGPSVQTKPSPTAKVSVAQQRRRAPLRTQVLGSLSRVEAALVRALRESTRTAALTPAHRAGLASSSPSGARCP
jgi:hypothetical protein